MPVAMRQKTWENSRNYDLEQTVVPKYKLERTEQFINSVNYRPEGNLSDTDDGILSSGDEHFFDMREEIDNVIKYSAFTNISEKPHVSMASAQEWEGEVQSIDQENDLFHALLYNMEEDGTRPSEMAEIPLYLLDEEDKEALCEGAVFRLIVGRERRRGSLKNTTLVYLRRTKFHPSSNIGLEPSFANTMAAWE